MKSNRRRFLTKSTAVAAAVALPSAARAQTAATDKPVKKVHWPGGKAPGKTPLFSGIVTFGNIVFIAGIGAHFEGDIKAHTKHVLDEIEKRLLSVGSSMEKVMKVNVYLNDLKDYAGMNEAFLGRFGAEPPVRTTIAAAGGIPAIRWWKSTASRRREIPGPHAGRPGRGLLPRRRRRARRQRGVPAPINLEGSARLFSQYFHNVSELFTGPTKTFFRIGIRLKLCIYI